MLASNNHLFSSLILERGTKWNNRQYQKSRIHL